MSASCARLVGAGALHPGSGSKAVESESFPWGRWGAAADMADPDPRYPCSSIEDDFNYGSCVASASVHIRMGTFSLPPLPHPAPVSAGRPAPSLMCCRPLGVAFSFRRQLLPGLGSPAERGSPRGSELSPASRSPPPLPGLRGRAPSPGRWEEALAWLRRRSQGERASGEAWWSPSRALRSGT